MTTKEEFRKRNIEATLKELKRAMSELLPVHTVTDRRVKSLKLNIDALEKELAKMRQGQLVFEDEDPNYDESMGF